MYQLTDLKLFAELRPPWQLLTGSGILAFNALMLLAWWILFPEQVPSNGAQVFFIILWLAAAWGLLLGERWIRVGIMFVLIAYLWGLTNQPTFSEGVSKINFADNASKLLALIAVVFLYLKPSRDWFTTQGLEQEH